MGYEVGDKVTLSPDSVWWGEDSQQNPRDLIGIVAKVTGSCEYCYVVWENGIENSYGESDLKVFGNTGMTPKEVEFWYE